MVEAILEVIWQRRLARGLPCTQGLCGRDGCETCARQHQLWVKFWQAMGTDPPAIPCSGQLAWPHGRHP